MAESARGGVMVGESKVVILTSVAADVASALAECSLVVESQARLAWVADVIVDASALLLT